MDSMDIYACTLPLANPRSNAFFRNSLHVAVCTGDVMLKVDDNFLDINEYIYHKMSACINQSTVQFLHRHLKFLSIVEMWSLKCEVHDVKFRNICMETHTENSHYIQGCWFNVNQYKTAYYIDLLFVPLWFCLICHTV